MTSLHRGLAALLLLSTAVGAPSTAAGATPARPVDVVRATETPNMAALGIAANPDPNTYPIVLTGDFTGDSNADLFFHSPSAAPDLLYDYDRIETADPTLHEMELSIHSFSVQGSYRPVVGFFGGLYNSPVDIFWYQPGAAPDMIWDFRGDCDPTGCETPRYQVIPQRVVGTYQPFVGSFSSSTTSDIFWYAPGAAQDWIWSYRGSCVGTCRTTRHDRAVTVNGTYKPVVGEFIEGAYGNDDIFWYSASGGEESIWDFSSYQDTTARIVKAGSLQVSNNTYRIAAGDLFADGAADIVFYGPGGTRDSVWDFFGGYIDKIAAPEPIGGNYSSVLVLDALGESEEQRNNEIREPEDIFLYDQATTTGRLYEIHREGTSFFFDRYDFDPMPVTELTPAGAGATAAAPEDRRWVGP